MLKSNLLIWFLVILLISLFLFSRLYNITNTLEFFGDIGRDHLVLLQWWQSGKIPLLGPGISYFSLHLPPIYFYLNYPVFLLSNFSPLTTLITTILIYTIMFLVGMKLLKGKNWKYFLLMIALLATFHPQYILQTRLPWNPSYTPPFLFLSVITLILMLEKISIRRIIFFSIGIAIAVSLSVQVIPVVFVLIISAFIICSRRMFLAVSIVSSFFIVFSPLIFFEIRHNLFFIRRLIIDPITQPFSTDMFLKLRQQGAFLFGISEWNNLSLLLFGGFLVIVIYQIIILLKNKQAEILLRKRVLLLTLLFISSLILTYITPFPAHEYDIFGTSVLLFSLVAFLPLRISLMGATMLIIIWINSFSLNTYNQPARRTIEQMKTCAIKVCQVEKSPMFIATEAWYVFHKTPEWQFFFSKAGCEVNDITEQPKWASKMALIADNAQYNHGKTSFNELTLFGNSKEYNIYQCDGNIKVYILEK